MKMQKHTKRILVAAILGLLAVPVVSHFMTEAEASPSRQSIFHRSKCESCGDCNGETGLGGSWFWMRSPDEEKVIVSGIFNRYCIRCHGVDGRGVWDIPGVPDFTNTRWQASRSDAQIARIIIEGRGAVMPAFRGTLSLEEAWAMARYLRTFVPGSEVSRPDLGAPGKTNPPKKDEPKSE
jgi:cytochrome c553